MYYKNLSPEAKEELRIKSHERYLRNKAAKANG